MSKAKPQNRIVGGLFGLADVPDSTGPRPAFLDGRSIFLVNARSGVWLLIDLLKPERVWLPSYLCHTILDGIGTGRAQVEFYEVDYDLRIPSTNWIEDIGLGDLVILIDYFGWLCDAEVITRVRKQGAWVLEDACQAMFTEGSGGHADFALFSPRKYLGVPDGAILRSNSPEMDFGDTRLSEPPGDWWLRAYEAALLRWEFDMVGGSRRWYELYQGVDATHPVGPYAGSHLSRTLIERGFDYSALAKRRVENYQYLAGELVDVALFPELPEGVVPLGFPIRIADRDGLRQMLFDFGIYPPIHWRIAGVVPERFEASHRLSNEILTLPCDQRYDADDMRRMAFIIAEELGNDRLLAPTLR